MDQRQDGAGWVGHRITGPASSLVSCPLPRVGLIQVRGRGGSRLHTRDFRSDASFPSHAWCSRRLQLSHICHLPSVSCMHRRQLDELRCTLEASRHHRDGAQLATITISGNSIRGRPASPRTGGESRTSSMSRLSLLADEPFRS